MSGTRAQARGENEDDRALPSIVLIAPRLQFISIDGAMHARETGAAVYNPSLDLGTHTLCEQIVPPGTRHESARQIAVARLCRRCFHRLSRFHRAIRVVEREVSA